MSVVRYSTARDKNVTVGLVRQPGGRLRIADDGAVEAVATYRCLTAIAVSKMPVRLVSRHPLYPGLVCNSVTAVEIEGGLTQVEVSYVGPSASTFTIGGIGVPVYELINEAREEPIETHPNFATFGVAGNGAKYDSNNIFIGFGKDPSTGSAGKFTGVNSYLAPTVVWRESKTSTTRPSSTTLASVGKISTPSGPAPTGSWLLRSFTYTQQGAVYRITSEWIRSGRGGWNKEIYT